jgi:hypothetical protein
VQEAHLEGKEDAFQEKEYISSLGDRAFLLNAAFAISPPLRQIPFHRLNPTMLSPHR